MAHEMGQLIVFAAASLQQSGEEFAACFCSESGEEFVRQFPAEALWVPGWRARRRLRGRSR
eukprot:3893497-Prymnesium_polylepis.1